MREENKKYIKSVIKTAGLGQFLTINIANMPEARAMCNEANINNSKMDDNFILYFATANESPKIEQLSKNKNASVYYYLDNMDNLLLFGKAEIITDKNITATVWQKSWEEHFCNGGKNDPTYCVIKFTPNAFKYYAVENGEYKKIEGKI